MDNYLNISLKEHKLNDFFIFILPEIAKDKKEVNFIFTLFLKIIKESEVKKIASFFRLITNYIPFETSLLLIELTEMFKEIGKDVNMNSVADDNSNIRKGVSEFIKHVIFNNQNIENNIYNILLSSPYLSDIEKIELFYFLSNSIYLSESRIQRQNNFIFNIPFFDSVSEKDILKKLRKIEYFNNNEEDLSLSSNILNSLLHHKSSTNRGENFVYNSNITNILEKNEDIEATNNMLIKLTNLIKNNPYYNVMFDKYVIYSLYIFTSLLRKKEFLMKCDQNIIEKLIKEIIKEIKSPLKKNDVRDIVFNQILSLFYMYRNFDFQYKFTDDLKFSINDFLDFYNIEFQEPNVLYKISNQVKEVLELQKEVIDKKDKRFKKNKTIIDIYIENIVKEKNITSKSELDFLNSVNSFAGDILFKNRDFYFFLKKEHNVFKNWIKEFDFIFYDMKKNNTHLKSFELKKKFLIDCMEKKDDVLFSLLMKNPYFMKVIFINDRKLFEEAFEKLAEIISKNDMTLSKIMLFKRETKDFNLLKILNSNNDSKELNKEFVLNYAKKSIQMEIVEDIKHNNLVNFVELTLNKILDNYSHLNNIDNDLCTDLFSILTNKEVVETNIKLLKKLYKTKEEVSMFIQEEEKRNNDFDSENNLYKTLIGKISIKNIIENIKEIVKLVSVKEININRNIKFNF